MAGKKKKLIAFSLIAFVALTLIVFIFLKSITFGKINFVEMSKDDESLGIENYKGTTNDDSTTPVVKEQEVQEYKDAGGIVNIALFGIDTRYEDDNGRSDSMIVMSIDFDRKKIKLSSFMRDLRVEMDGNRFDKLNHAYSYGGGAFSVKTFNQNFGLDIRNFVTANFYSLEKAINIVGGVEIDVTNEEMKEINYRIKEIANISGKESYTLLETSGLQLLNGEQAVAYARIRSTAGGDYKRTERQREVLTLLIDKVQVMPLQNIFDMCEEIFPLVHSSMTDNEMFGLLVRYFKVGGGFEVETMRFPVDGTFESDMSTGVYYMLPNSPEELKQMVQDYIYSDIVPNKPE